MRRPRELPRYPRQPMDPLQAFVASPSGWDSSISRTESEHLAIWTPLSPSNTPSMQVAPTDSE